MAIHLIKELWMEYKRFISPVDRDETADILVNLLIDNDIDLEEIKSIFKGDPDIKKVLAQFAVDIDEGSEEDYEDEDEDDDDQ